MKFYGWQAQKRVKQINRSYRRYSSGDTWCNYLYLYQPTAFWKLDHSSTKMDSLSNSLSKTISSDGISSNWTKIYVWLIVFDVMLVNKKKKIFFASTIHYTTKNFRHFVSFCLNVTMFGAAAVFLLLAAKNFEDFLHVYGDIRINFCYLVIVVAVVMFPLTLFRSPKDFWYFLSFLLYSYAVFKLASNNYS